MSQVLCRLASYPFADWASFAVFAFAGKSLMKSWHELDDRVWFSLTNCRVMNFISLRKVTRKKESKKLKKPKKQRIWSFCAALQVVGPKPARSFIWRGEGGKLPSDSVRQKFLYLSPSPTFATAYSKHFPTLARTMCCHRRGLWRAREWGVGSDGPRYGLSPGAHFRYMPNTFGLCPETAEVSVERIQINHLPRKVWVPQHKANLMASVSGSNRSRSLLSPSPSPLLSASSYFSSRTRRFYDIPILT